MISTTGPCIKLTTFSSTDAKLRRLFCWYQHHKGEIILHTRHQKCLSRLNIVDITKLRYSEKIAWIKVLRAAKKTWMNMNDNKQQLITKFFTHNKAANFS